MENSAVIQTKATVLSDYLVIKTLTFTGTLWRDLSEKLN